MRILTAEVKVAKRLLETRVCLLLVFVLVCSIDGSTSSGLSTETTTRSNAISFRPPGNLTVRERGSVVANEFNFWNISQQDRAAVRIAYLEVRRKILAHLNSRRSTTVPPTYTTAITAVAITTSTPTTSTATTSTTPITRPIAPTSPTTTAAAPTTTTTATTTKDPNPVEPSRERKRKSQNKDENNITFTDMDLRSIEIEPEIDKNENENPRISLFLETEVAGSADLLYKVVKALNESGGFESAADGTVVDIYRGSPMLETLRLNLDFLIPILMAISVLLIVLVFVCYWKARNKKIGGKMAGMCWSGKDPSLC